MPAFFVFILDQLTKIYVKFNYDPGFSDSILGPFLKLTYIENPGLAFGVSVGSFAWLLFVVTIIITLYIVYYLIATANLDYYEKISLSFILGGALGNLVDRGFYLFNMFGYNGVIDFIDIGLFNYSFRYPYIFNLADLGVTVGISIYLISSFFEDKKEIHEVA